MPAVTKPARDAPGFIRGEESAVPYLSPLSAPCGEPLFCEERLNLARKGLCDAGIAPRLLSAMLSKLVMPRALF